MMARGTVVLATLLVGCPEPPQLVDANLEEAYRKSLDTCAPGGRDQLKLCMADPGYPSTLIGALRSDTFESTSGQAYPIVFETTSDGGAGGLDIDHLDLSEVELSMTGTCDDEYRFVVREPITGELLMAGGNGGSVSFDGWSVSLDEADGRCVPLACGDDRSCRSVPLTLSVADVSRKLYSRTTGVIDGYQMAVFESTVTERDDGSKSSVTRWGIVRRSGSVDKP